MSPVQPAATLLLGGAATIDITPAAATFLYGYPHVPRTSTGVHDPLECAALYLKSGDDEVIFLANDLICVSQSLVARVRGRIQEATGIPANAIMITATHTHSGPVMVEYLSNAADPVVPKPDASYLAWLEGRMVAAATQAVRSAVLAELGFSIATATGVGTNRHDPAGPSDPEVPVLVARAISTGVPLGCMVVYAMHPTVLHEDSTLFSGDFPFFTRQFLRGAVLPATCPVLFHQGASGNQSPRHVTRANTFAEAQRLGENLGRAIAAAAANMSFIRDVRVAAQSARVALTPREFPAASVAEAAVQHARTRYEELKRGGAPRPQVRTAECDVFGAEETAELARAAANGRLESEIAVRSPAEVQAIRLGPWIFAAWPGEFFVEYALQVRARAPDVFVITLANGELQGYIVTPDAAERGVYESTNAVFAPVNGERFVEATLALVAALR